MKTLLLFTLFFLSFSRFIVRDLLESKNCSSKVTQGYLTQPGYCMMQDRFYTSFHNNGTFYTMKTFCQNGCVGCRQEHKFNYQCYKQEAVTLRFGIPPQISSKGFYFYFYRGIEICDSHLDYIQGFVVDEVCQNHERSIMGIFEKGKSAKIFYDSVRKGVISREFDNENCTGSPRSIQFIPEGKCTQPNLSPSSYRIKVFRNL